jgi:23S rRNA (pseudouridine1915-N3)-methyltransferase
MRIVLAIVSSIKDKEIKNLTQEWVKRTGKFASVELVEFSKKESLEEIRLKYKSFHIIALAENGRSYTSLKFADRVQHLANYQNSSICFVVSDADGFQKNDLKYADEVLSLSELTFPHELALLVLSEQIYRALSILNNHPYHRE